MTFKTLSFTTALVLASAVAYAQAPPPAPAAAPAPQGPPPQPVLGPNEWNIDSTHSTAGFTVTHLMVSTVPGSFGKVSGKITYDGKNVSSIAADVTIDATTITTNNERRDTHLKSPDFFEVAKYPTLTFKSKKVVPGAAGKFKLVGDLTMHGVTKEVTFDVEGPTGPGQRRPQLRGRRDGHRDDQPQRLGPDLEPRDRGRRRDGQRRGQDHARASKPTSRTRTRRPRRRARVSSRNDSGVDSTPESSCRVLADHLRLDGQARRL